MPSERFEDRDRSMNEFPEDPQEVLVRWTFLYDNIPEDLGGGFVTGEFALLVDGRLFRRAAHDEHGLDGSTWKAGPWELDSRWNASTDVGALFDALREFGYELFPATPP